MLPCGVLSVLRAAPRLAAALSLAMAVVLPAPRVCAGTEPLSISLERQGSLLAVKTGFYTVSISPDNGGRIVSCVFGGIETTRLCADGRGGLMEEEHTADLPYEVVDQKVEGNRVELTLAAGTEELRVVKQYEFEAERPWFTVRFSFENRSPWSLSGAALPAVRQLVEPGGPEAAPHQLYCMDRGLGAEILPPEAFLGRLHGVPPAQACVRWMAAAEPASRRAVGFALSHAGCRSLRPQRTDGGGITFGWRYPSLPAGQRLVSSIMVAPLANFAAVGELNGQFAADSLVDRTAAGLTVRLRVVPLAADMTGVSIVTRVFDRAGKELRPLDTLLFGMMELLHPYAGDLHVEVAGQEPAWLVHEVYSRGMRSARFVVPLGEQEAAPPVSPDKPAPPSYEPVEGYAVPAPGSLIPLTQARTDRGFLLWKFDGGPAREEVQNIELTLARGEKRTLFLGLRALRPIQSLRMTLAGLDVERTGLRAVPPAAVYVWRLQEDGTEGAMLTPLSDLSLEADEVAWLAITADSGLLQAGTYAARIVATADGAVSEVPLKLRVAACATPSASSFGFWFVGGDDGSLAPGLAWTALAGYGVRGLTASTSDGWDTAFPLAAAACARETGLDLLAFTRRDGTLPPLAPAPGALLVPYAQPIWLLRAWGASPAAVPVTGDAGGGYALALLCDRLTSLPQSVQGLGRGPRPVGGSGGPSLWLVRDGCEPGAVSAAVESGLMDGSETVWLYLDLNEADWQRAATQVRSALWAAAWQGLAGVAVSCAAPPAEADRQPAIWHVLRDAVSEVALWRESRTRARVLAEAGAATTAPRIRPRLAAEALDGVVGPAPGCDLVLESHRRAFGTVLRVALAGEGAPLNRFESARHKVIDLASQLSAPAQSGRAGEPLYWRGMPLLEDGRVRWRIVAASGEQAWKTATGLQEFLQRTAGCAVPLSRAFPRLEAGGAPMPSLIWVITDGAGGTGLPEAVQSAIAGRSGAPLVTVQLKDGPRVAVLCDSRSLNALLRTFQRQTALYPTARQVQ